MKLYRIKRKSDGRFYRGKSKFTTHGTFFRLQQIESNLNWVQSQLNISGDYMILIAYDIQEGISINVGESDVDEISKILIRDIRIGDILD